MTTEFEASIEALAPWIGKRRIAEDEISLSAVRRVAAVLASRYLDRVSEALAE